MKPAAKTILVVEDEAALAKGLIYALKAEGFGTRYAENGEDALGLLRTGGIDLVLLDIRLPGIDGFEVCRRLRKQGYKLPVIMVTARDEEIDRVLGLEIGADDYVVKPYSLRELISRVRAHLRRSYGELAGNEETRKQEEVAFGRIRLDMRSFRAFRDESEIFLTPIELKMLLYFLDNAEISLSRQSIINAVWGQNIFLEDERTVDVHLRHLREKIEEDPGTPKHILTVRGFGYRFIKNP